MRFKFVSRLALALAAALALTGAAHANLVATDFWTAGDRYLVQDSSTDLEWLSPVATRGHVFNDATVQALLGEGFHYATRNEVIDMIDANFGLATTVRPGDAAGYAIAEDFFAVFGITAAVRCQVGKVFIPCPRTQGLTGDAGGAGKHMAVGMLQYGSTGYLIDNNPWPDGIYDDQMGNWLVRGDAQAPQALPEPGSLALLSAALVAAWPLSRRRKSLGNLA